ncbi:MAG: uroporphyrinogen-III C-methyltransferase [Phascolarctobacterium sp.]|uniref:uroporphyrinogen-III C-methyltransferase n=1 Tax=Phascolarctobacterium sp. TaxID=2049039 RepID=UPI0026DB04A6|nr:uroporphyrinogen-III C-methyltransferase [Phascolarctobacterium sp.]MDO4921786.1 uroporphyrinogen-III C-methyltransferase [Phascolarctobacterium sp.]
MTKQGKVYLIGAGPGDPGLLGLKAKECLETADAVVYDRLADPRILAFARKDAEMVYVGKASANHTMRQPDINKLLVKLAQEGKTVARLKGGDPFVFGRGGEEAIELLEAGQPFEFVPGVTSAIAVAEYAGIPVTHRHVATSFAVITGHEDPTKGESTINWQGLATAVDTLVFLMGVENIEKISKQLIANGRSASCPAAVIRWGTHPEQRTLVTTLGAAAEDVKKNNLKPPAIFIVGEVVKLREQLQWFDNKPLFGKTVIVTRARAQASELTKKLEARGAKVIEVPAIKIVPAADYAPLDKAIGELNAYKWLVFTSANGVDYFFQRLLQAGKDARALANAKLAAIGSATAQALAERGLAADLIPSAYKAEELAEALADKIVPGDKILIARAKVAREVLPESLRKIGADVNVVTAYETVADCENKDELLAALQNGDASVVTFTSSSTVTNLLKVLGNEQKLLANAALAAIGPVTAETLRKHGFAPAIEAQEYTIDGLMRAIENFYHK